METELPIVEMDSLQHHAFVYGSEAVERLRECNILISGMNGLGVEIAKILMLSGVKSIALHDDGTVDVWDFSGNFILSEEDLGKNKALAAVNKLQDINQSVKLYVLNELSKQRLSAFEVVVFTDIALQQAMDFDTYCHNHNPPIPFIKAEVRGLFGKVFCDFGPDFKVLDVDGGTEVKEPKAIKFKTLRQAIHDSNYNSPSPSPTLIDLAFQALDDFRSEWKRLPLPGSDEDARKIIVLLRSINNGLDDRRLEEVDENLLRNFSFGSRAVLSPMATMFGGIVGQEVVKACSGKFHPIFQFLYYDSAESFPSEPVDPGDLNPLNSRYDAQISVFGSNMQKKLEEAKIFILGSGISECELLKTIALMGVCCGKEGKVTLTDDRYITEQSITRNFLFRNSDIGRKKSTTAASAASLINPDIHIEALKERLSSETEYIFYELWKNMSVVLTGVANANSKMYINQRCLTFQRPFLVSEINGTDCNTQVFIPKLTKDYKSTDPMVHRTVHTYENQRLEDEFVIYPQGIEHCLSWARYELWSFLEKTPAETNIFLSETKDYLGRMNRMGETSDADPTGARLLHLKECIGRDRCIVFQDCVAWARWKFEDLFFIRIKILTEEVPEDSVYSDGESFWSAPNHFPHPIQFSNEDPSHINFVIEAALLRADTLGINIPDWANGIDMYRWAEAIDAVDVSEYQEWIHNDGYPEVTSGMITVDRDIFDQFVIKLLLDLNNLPRQFQMKRIELGKEHMRLLTGLANLKARVYHIPEVDNERATFIVWGITPELASSTAVATGLLCLQIYKLLGGNQNKLEDYRNTLFNLSLAVPNITKHIPTPCDVQKYNNLSWTLWDRWVFNGDPTLRELIEWTGRTKSLFGLGYYFEFGDADSVRIPFASFDKKLTSTYEELSGTVLPRYQRSLDVLVDVGGLAGKCRELCAHISICFK